MAAVFLLWPGSYIIIALHNDIIVHQILQVKLQLINIFAAKEYVYNFIFNVSRETLKKLSTKLYVSRETYKNFILLKIIFNM